MQGMIRCGLLAGFLVACHTSAPGMPDGAGTDGSTGSGAAGLHVAFTSEPTLIPGPLDDGVTLELAMFKFDNLKVIGDAGPGDPRTTADNFDVNWDSQRTPTPIAFADAPTGLYSKVSFQIDGHLINESYTLKGHVSVNGTSYPYEIEDRSPLSLSLDCNRMLAVGGTDTIKVKFAFKDAVTSINWQDVHNRNGTLTVDDTDPQILTFHSKLSDAISIDNSGPH